MDDGPQLLDFFTKLLIGSGMIVLNLGIQVWAVDRVFRFFQRREFDAAQAGTTRGDFKVLSIIMAFLFAGHLVQFATWALLFVVIGEFDNFGTAFYHSTVNFTSLGYGDIVMSESWRLLGALEAANGVLMFGLTAGLILSVMNKLFSYHQRVDQFPGPNDSGDAG
jgi:hypothetical protein